MKTKSWWFVYIYESHWQKPCWRFTAGLKHNTCATEIPVPNQLIFCTFRLFNVVFRDVTMCHMNNDLHVLKFWFFEFSTSKHYKNVIWCSSCRILANYLWLHLYIFLHIWLFTSMASNQYKEYISGYVYPDTVKGTAISFHFMAEFRFHCC